MCTCRASMTSRGKGSEVGDEEGHRPARLPIEIRDSERGRTIKSEAVLPPLIISIVADMSWR